MSPRFCVLASIVALSGLSVSGCDYLGDPYARPGTWTPTGVNTANLQAMVAVPADLQSGRGDDTALGQTAAAAVQRLREGKVKPLPDSALSDVKVSGTGAASAGAGGAQ